MSDTVNPISSVKLALEQLRPYQKLDKSSRKRTEELVDEEVDARSAEDDQDQSRKANVKTTSAKKKRIKRHSAVTDPSDSDVMDDLRSCNIDSRVGQVLIKELKLERLFLLQAYSLKEITQSPNRDVCISAPTGSGKTLMYLIPLVNSLAGRRVMRLRGLVLVPTRDLTIQVYAVAKVLCDGLGLKCNALLGDVSMKEESEKLVGRAFSSRLNTSPRYESLVDLLITTPGRLLDHLDKTPGLTLEHLETLVVDEADKLLSQTYQDWLDRIYRAASRQETDKLVSLTNPDRVTIPNQLTIRSMPSNKLSAFSYDREESPRMRRILCSATLTNNPQKLAALALVRPVLIDSQSVQQLAGEETREPSGSAQMSPNLVEQEYKVTLKNKPIVLLWVLEQLLSENSANRVLVFAGSVERASRIHSLISTVLGKKCGANCSLISSDQSQSERRQALESFRSRATRILVASDLAARGIDIPDLEYVLSYDAPQHATTYVHRAGRTARAGKKGTSVLLLQREDLKRFAQIKEKLGLSPTNLLDVDSEACKQLTPAFKEWHDKADASIA